MSYHCCLHTSSLSSSPSPVNRVTPLSGLVECAPPPPPWEPPARLPPFSGAGPRDRKPRCVRSSTRFANRFPSRLLRLRRLRRRLPRPADRPSFASAASAMGDGSPKTRPDCRAFARKERLPPQAVLPRVVNKVGAERPEHSASAPHRIAMLMTSRSTSSIATTMGTVSRTSLRTARTARRTRSASLSRRGGRDRRARRRGGGRPPARRRPIRAARPVLRCSRARSPSARALRCAGALGRGGLHIQCGAARRVAIDRRLGGRRTFRMRPRAAVDRPIDALPVPAGRACVEAPVMTWRLQPLASPPAGLLMSRRGFAALPVARYPPRPVSSFGSSLRRSRRARRLALARWMMLEPPSLI